MRLVLLGHVPSKKNEWGPRKGGGIVLSRGASRDIESLISWANYGWRGKPALEHPKMRVKFFVLNQRSDRDNKLSTILDVLQKAHVITNDNIAHFNGDVTILPAQVSDKESTVIEFELSEERLTT